MARCAVLLIYSNILLHKTYSYMLHIAFRPKILIPPGPPRPGEYFSTQCNPWTIWCAAVRAKFTFFGFGHRRAHCAKKIFFSPNSYSTEANKQIKKKFSTFYWLEFFLFQNLGLAARPLKSGHFGPRAQKLAIFHYMGPLWVDFRKNFEKKWLI